MNSETITREQLCSMFDHSLLQAFSTEEELRKCCEEAREYGFAMVAINSYPVAFCKEILKGTKVHVGAAISFPLGQTTIEVKVAETQDAINKGADEIDYVLNVAKVKEGNYEYIEDEMNQIVSVCKKNNVISKVIYEICYLTDEEIIKISQIAKKVGIDYVKTSTGFGPSGATVKAIKLMKENVGDKVKVKAAGGIHTWNFCRQLIDAGADRIGTISSVKIVKGYDECMK